MQSPQARKSGKNRYSFSIPLWKNVILGNDSYALLAADKPLPLLQNFFPKRKVDDFCNRYNSKKKMYFFLKSFLVVVIKMSKDPDFVAFSENIKYTYYLPTGQCLQCCMLVKVRQSRK